jgi:hypothetical protein
LWIELQTRSQQGWRRGSSGGARLTSTKALNSNPNTTKKKKKRRRRRRRGRNQQIFCQWW